MAPKSVFGIDFYPEFRINRFRFGRGMQDVAVKAIEEHTRQFAESFQDMRGFLKDEARPIIIKKVKESFASESGLGTVWPKLSKRYELMKSKKAPGMKMGLLTTRLYNALTSWNRFGSIFRITKKSMFLGIDMAKIPYAQAFYYGAIRSPNRIRKDLGKERPIPGVDSDAKIKTWKAQAYFPRKVGFLKRRRERGFIKRLDNFSKKSGISVGGYQPPRPWEWYDSNTLQDIIASARKFLDYKTRAFLFGDITRKKI